MDFVKEDSLVSRLLPERDRSLLRQATLIDRVDRVLGPVESALQLYGSPVLTGVGVCLEVVEVAFFKLPFAVRYLRHTRDYGALASWLPKELFAAMVPFGDLIDLTHAYHNQARRYFEGAIMREGQRKGYKQVSS